MKNLKTITINGDRYALGKDKAVGFGLNMQNKIVLTEAVIHHDNNGFYLVSGGIKIRVSEGLENLFLADLYLDTPANRILLKSLKSINNTKNQSA